MKYVASRFEREHPEVLPLDLAGVTILSADTDSMLLPLGKFFASLDIPVFAFCDTNPRRTAEEAAELEATYNSLTSIPYASMEKLLVDVVPLDRQWELLDSIREDELINLDNKYGIPAERPNDKAVKKLSQKFLKRTKGENGAAMLLSKCESQELPNVVIEFLETIYPLFTLTAETEAAEAVED